MSIMDTYYIRMGTFEYILYDCQIKNDDSIEYRFEQNLGFDDTDLLEGKVYDHRPGAGKLYLRDLILYEKIS